MIEKKKKKRFAAISHSDKVAYYELWKSQAYWLSIAGINTLS